MSSVERIKEWEGAVLTTSASGLRLWVTPRCRPAFIKANTSLSMVNVDARVFNVGCLLLLPPVQNSFADMLPQKKVCPPGGGEGGLESEKVCTWSSSSRLPL